MGAVWRHCNPNLAIAQYAMWIRFLITTSRSPEIPPFKQRIQGERSFVAKDFQDIPLQGRQPCGLKHRADCPVELPATAQKGQHQAHVFAVICVLISCHGIAPFRDI